MPTPTTTYSFSKPTVGGDDNAWGTELNANLDKLDDLLDGTIGITPNLIAGWEVGGVAVTASAAELNLLDGVTASTAELNILDGVTASTAELNILDGVTASTAELNVLDGITATTAELNVLDGIAGIASQVEAEAGTATDKLMTPERTKQAIDALAVSTQFTNFQLFTTAGTWTRPAGVNTVYAIVFGGGGGGPQSTNTNQGGYGGLAAGFLSVSGNVSVTVGAGGTGSNTANGTAGGTSSFSTISATGGGGDFATNGAGSGGDVANTNMSRANDTLGDLFNAVISTILPNGWSSGVQAMYSQVSTRVGGSTSPAVYSTTVPGPLPGARGQKEVSSSSNDASGGVGGAVWVFW
jgi:hypothetical protein